ncbi:MAG: hypothetical protein LUE93_04140 [Bacteroides sp.]|nr:hypothetical protein [Bacteroides sp.]
MKNFRFIVALLLCFTVIFAGAGATIIHYCCVDCEEMGLVAIESSGCHEQHHKESHSSCCGDAHSCHEEDPCCPEEGCSAELARIDMVNETVSTEVSFSPEPLFVLLIPGYLLTPEVKEQVYEPSLSPPCPDTSRYYLNLYSVLLI